MKNNADFADAVARARKESAHGMAEQVVEIADECSEPSQVNIARNRIDARKWLAGKYNAVYADRGPNEPSPTLLEGLSIEDQRVLASMLATMREREPPTIEHEGSTTSSSEASSSSAEEAK